jgi:hypothetical protein
MGDSMPLITAKSGREMLASWGSMKFSLFCLTSLQGFCSNFTLIDNDRFESLDLPFIPADRSDFDVHRALLHDKVHEYVIL